MVVKQDIKIAQNSNQNLWRDLISAVKIFEHKSSSLKDSALQQSTDDLKTEKFPLRKYTETVLTATVL